MKYLIVIFTLILSLFCYSQSSMIDSINDDPTISIYKRYPAHSIIRNDISRVKTITDLDSTFKTSWISEYEWMKVIATVHGHQVSTQSNNDTLTIEQLELIQQADLGTDIKVWVYYLPENNLIDNERKYLDFVFEVLPEKDAEFPHGEAQLQQYIDNHISQNIPCGTFVNYDLAIVHFQIDTAGKICELLIDQSSKDQKTDQMILDMLSNMPTWTPAEYHDGTLANQDQVLLVGNIENCNANLLNIKR